LNITLSLFSVQHHSTIIGEGAGLGRVSHLCLLFPILDHYHWLLHLTSPLSLLPLPFFFFFYIFTIVKGSVSFCLFSILFIDVMDPLLSFSSLRCKDGGCWRVLTYWRRWLFTAWWGTWVCQIYNWVM